MAPLNYSFILTIWFGGPLGKAYWNGPGWQNYTANRPYPFDWSHFTSDAVSCKKVFGVVKPQEVQLFLVQLLGITAGAIAPVQDKGREKDKRKGKGKRTYVDEDSDDEEEKEKEEEEPGVPGECFANPSAGAKFMKASNNDQFNEGRSWINTYWAELFRQRGSLELKLIALVDEYDFHPRERIGNDGLYKPEDFPKRTDSLETCATRSYLMSSLFGPEIRRRPVSESSAPHKWAGHVYARLLNNAWGAMRKSFVRDLSTLKTQMRRVKSMATACSKMFERSQNDPETTLDIKSMQKLVSAYKEASRILEVWNLTKYANWHKNYMKIFQLADRSLALAAASIEAESCDQDMHEMELPLRV